MRDCSSEVGSIFIYYTREAAKRIEENISLVSSAESFTTQEEDGGTINAFHSGSGREAYPIFPELIDINVTADTQWYDEHVDDEIPNVTFL